MEAGLPSTPAKLLLGLPLGLLAALIGIVLSVALVAGASPTCQGEKSGGALGSQVPKRLVPIYEQAAARYRLGERGPSILAAINWVETGFGQPLGKEFHFAAGGGEEWTPSPALPLRGGGGKRRGGFKGQGDRPAPLEQFQGDAAKGRIVLG